MTRGSRLAAVGLAVLAASLAAPPSGAEIYRWTDAAGEEHFTTRLDDVPSVHRDAARRRAAGSTLNSYESERGEAPPAEASVPGAEAPAGRGRRRPPGGPPAAPAPAEETYGGRSEAWWRGEYTRQVQEIERYEATAELCEGEEAPVRGDPLTGRRMKEQHYERAAAGFARCEEARYVLDGLRRALDRFVENARQQGVPPGWVR